jgi:ATP-dependent RNA helicase DDX24/MAK5
MNEATKRKLPTGGVPKSAKRTKTLSTHQKQKSKKTTKRTVAVDALSWSKAQLPDMFDDAEGFYGLEEVEGVEVIRDNGNTIEFVCYAILHLILHSTDSSKRTAVPVDNETDGTNDANDASDAIEHDSDEFEGFDDDDESPAIFEPKAAKPASKAVPKKSETEPKKKQKQNKKLNEKEDRELETNIFGGLDDVDETQDDMDLSEWVKLDISAGILSSLAKLKFSKPTPIQAASIPHILAGHDVIGKASTGSGKTLAFGIPIVEKWLELADEKRTETATETETETEAGAKTPLALILSPTRELAHQLTEHIKNLCRSLPSSPYICSVTGGLSVQKQQRQLLKADIVIGTPGRLWEVLSSSAQLMKSFKGISYLVVDEADRLLTAGLFKEAEEILNALDRGGAVDEEEEDAAPTPRQTLVFSATFHKGLQQKLAGKGKSNLMSEEDSMEYLLKKLNFREEDPKFIDMNPVSQMAEGLKEGLVECGAMEKVDQSFTTILTSSRNDQWHHANRYVGSIPLFSATIISEYTDTGVHQLYQHGSTHYTNAKEHEFKYTPITFTNGAKGTFAVYRTLHRDTSQPVGNPGRHRCRCSRSRYTQC